MDGGGHLVHRRGHLFGFRRWLSIPRRVRVVTPDSASEAPAIRPTPSCNWLTIPRRLSVMARIAAIS